MICRFTAITAFALWSLLSSVQASTTSSPAPTRASTALVNINTADAATLAREMKGIGESKARAIVEHRQKNGAFRSIDELALVKGIGAKTLDNNRARLTIGAGGTSTRPSASPPVAGAGARVSSGQSLPKPSTGGR
jgi:competence protein ComEA